MNDIPQKNISPDKKTASKKPSKPFFQNHFILWMALIVVSFVAFGIYSMSIGVDCNYDLRNYHFYTPYAVLHDRLLIDHHPAGIQTTINPTLDLLLTYPLIRYASPSIFAFMLGGLNGFNFVLLVAISLQFLSRNPYPEKKLHQVLLALFTSILGVAGANASSEIGTSYGDLTLSALNLAAILAVLMAIHGPVRKQQVRLIVLSGVLVGLSTGLKLTNAVYALALLATLMVFFARRPLLPLSAAIAAFVGVLITHGWWSATLYADFQNPFFPFYNAIFKSPSYPAVNFSDIRFLPEGIVKTLFYPFFFSWDGSTSEPYFRDFRFPLAYICVIFLTFIFCRQLKENGLRTKVKSDLSFLSLFLIFSYVIWQHMFSIQRYGITMELLLPLFILLTLIKLIPKHAVKSFIIIAFFLLFSTIVPVWVNAPLSSEHPFYQLRDQLRLTLGEPEYQTLNHSAIILGTQPLGFLAPSLDLTDAIWLGKPFNEFDRQIALKKLQTRNSVYFITTGNYYGLEEGKEVLSAYNLPWIKRENCRRLSELVICRMQ